MQLWLIERVKLGQPDAAPYPFMASYGEHESAVIRAETEADARRIASEQFLPSDVWFHPSTHCIPITPEGPVGVIHVSIIED